MINLIPPYDQNRLRSDRLKRILTAFGFFVMTMIIFGFVVLLPSFIALQYMIADFSYAREIEERSPVNRALEERTRALTDFELRARDVLSHARIPPSFADIVKEIIRVAPEGIDLITIHFENNIFTIEGRYQHRSLFLSFLEILKTHTFVKSISSPLSNILKEADAPFLITIAL